MAKARGTSRREPWRDAGGELQKVPTRPQLCNRLCPHENEAQVDRPCNLNPVLPGCIPTTQWWLVAKPNEWASENTKFVNGCYAKPAETVPLLYPLCDPSSHFRVRQGDSTWGLCTRLWSHLKLQLQSMSWSCYSTVQCHGRKSALSMKTKPHHTLCSPAPWLCTVPWIYHVSSIWAERLQEPGQAPCW